MNIFQTVLVSSAVIMVVLVLIQTRGASLGAGFGGSGELYTQRRGVEKNLFSVAATVFVGSIVMSILLG